jgi:hypothetical protein
MFKKLSVFTVYLLSVLFFVSCSSTPSVETSKGELSGAPKWVLMPFVEGSMSDIGSAPSNAGGDVSFQRNQAMADARDNLARQMGVKVGNMIKSFKASTGAKADATFDQSSEQVSKQIASQTLVGTKIKDAWISDSGTMYVLVVLDTEAVIDQMDKNIKTSMGNEKAMYQKFLAKKSQDELAKELEAFNKENSQ